MSWMILFCSAFCLFMLLTWYFSCHLFQSLILTWVECNHSLNMSIQFLFSVLEFLSICFLKFLLICQTLVLSFVCLFFFAWSFKVPLWCLYYLNFLWPFFLGYWTLSSSFMCLVLFFFIVTKHFFCLELFALSPFCIESFVCGLFLRLWISNWNSHFEIHIECLEINSEPIAHVLLY